MISQYQEIYDFGYDKNFLFKDKQLGQNVIVNGKNVYDEFDADLISVMPVSPTIEKSVYKSLGKYNYKINTFRVGDNGLELKFYVGGHTYQEAQINVNQLINEFVNKVAIVKIDESDFEYVCSLESFGSEFTGVEFYYLVTINVIAVKRLPIVTLNYGSTYFTEDTTVQIPFENAGVVESGLDIIVRFGGTASFEIDHKKAGGNIQTLHFTNLSTSNYYYKVGGLDGVVQRAGNIAITSSVTNVFLKTDLIDFPVVNAGQNNITFVQNAVGNIKQVRLQFYPTFLV